MSHSLPLGIGLLVQEWQNRWHSRTMRKGKSPHGDLVSAFSSLWLGSQGLCCVLCLAQFLTGERHLMDVEWVNKNGAAPWLRMSNVAPSSVGSLPEFQAWPISGWNLWLLVIPETCQHIITGVKGSSDIEGRDFFFASRGQNDWCVNSE